MNNPLFGPPREVQFPEIPRELHHVRWEAGQADGVIMERTVRRLLNVELNRPGELEPRDEFSGFRLDKGHALKVKRMKANPAGGMPYGFEVRLLVATDATILDIWRIVGPGPDALVFVQSFNMPAGASPLSEIEVYGAAIVVALVGYADNAIGNYIIRFLPGTLGEGGEEPELNYWRFRGLYPDDPPPFEYGISDEEESQEFEGSWQMTSEADTSVAPLVGSLELVATDVQLQHQGYTHNPPSFGANSSIWPKERGPNYFGTFGMSYGSQIHYKIANGTRNILRDIRDLSEDPEEQAANLRRAVAFIFYKNWDTRGKVWSEAETNFEYRIQFRYLSGAVSAMSEPITISGITGRDPAKHNSIGFTLAVHESLEESVHSIAVWRSVGIPGAQLELVASIPVLNEGVEDRLFPLASLSTYEYPHRDTFNDSVDGATVTDRLPVNYSGAMSEAGQFICEWWQHEGSDQFGDNWFTHAPRRVGVVRPAINSSSGGDCRNRHYPVCTASIAFNNWGVYAPNQANWRRRLNITGQIWNNTESNPTPVEPVAGWIKRTVALLDGDIYFWINEHCTLDGEFNIEQTAVDGDQRAKWKFRSWGIVPANETTLIFGGGRIPVPHINIGNGEFGPGASKVWTRGFCGFSLGCGHHYMHIDMEGVTQERIDDLRNQPDWDDNFASWRTYDRKPLLQQVPIWWFPGMVRVESLLETDAFCSGAGVQPPYVDKGVKFADQHIISVRTVGRGGTAAFDMRILAVGFSADYSRTEIMQHFEQVEDWPYSLGDGPFEASNPLNMIPLIHDWGQPVIIDDWDAAVDPRRPDRPVRGRHIAFVGGRLVNLNIDWVDHYASDYRTFPARLAWSVFGRFDRYDPTNYLELGHTDDGKGVGLAQFGGFLVILGTTFVTALDVSGGSEMAWRVVEEWPHIGCIGPHAYCETPHGVFWCDKEYAYFWDGQTLHKATESVVRTVKETYRDYISKLHSVVYRPSTAQVWIIAEGDTIEEGDTDFGSIQINIDMNPEPTGGDPWYTWEIWTGDLDDPSPELYAEGQGKAVLHNVPPGMYSCSVETPIWHMPSFVTIYPQDGEVVSGSALIFSGEFEIAPG